MSPERELLIACARTTIDPATRQRIQALASAQPDWRCVIALAQLHGTRPLLFHALSLLDAGLVPPDIWRQLQAHYCAVTLQNARMTQALVETLAVLRAHAIEALPLKGPALASVAYGNTLREFGDLDILVRREEVGSAIDVLLAHGFEPRSGAGAGVDLEVDPGAKSLRTGRYHLLRRRRDGIDVDLQWRVASRHFLFSLDHETLLERPHPIRLAETTVSGLSPEATLVVLCIHGSKHLWSRLKWVCDVAELVRAVPDIDWRRASEVANGLHCTRLLLLGAVLSHDLLDAPVPAPVLAQARRNTAVRTLAARYADALRMGDEPQDAEAERVADYLLLRDRARDRLRFLLHLSRTIAPDDRTTLRQLPRLSQAIFYGLVPVRGVVAPLVRSRAAKSALSHWMERTG